MQLRCIVLTQSLTRQLCHLLFTQAEVTWGQSLALCCSHSYPEANIDILVSKFSLSLTCTHTHKDNLTHLNGDSSLITWPYTHMHKLPPPTEYTRTRSPMKFSPMLLTRFLGSQPTSTTTHSSANELISWFHSFHCCHTPSISPFLPSLKTSRGAQRAGREEGPETSRQFKDSSFLIRYGSPEIWCFDDVHQCGCMCVT